MTRKFLTPVVLPADPATAMEAATKQYVDFVALAAAAAQNEVYIGNTDPGASYELWVDTT